VARYNASLDTERTLASVFAYLSDFSSTREWDPNVVDAERIGDGPIAVGTEFRLWTSFAGRRSAITYRVVEFDPPRAVTFRGENALVTSLDRITFEAIEGGTRVVYDADLRLKGLFKVGEPLLRLALNRLGRQALAGLRRTLGSQPPSA
jgi:carbon monoxide dehydrogenase subunit G